MYWFFVVLWCIIVLSFLKDLFAWLKIFQIKEYRWPKYKEYLSSEQGKRALTNIKQRVRLLEFIVLLPLSLYWIEGAWLSFTVFAVTCLWGITELTNLIVGYRQGFSLPVFTKRLLVTVVVTLLLLVFGRWILGHFLFGLVLASVCFLLLLPFFIGCMSFLFYPLDHFFTKRLVRKAQNHFTNLGTDVIAISGSYGKSTIKKFLDVLLSPKYTTQRTSGNVNTVKGIANFILGELQGDADVFICEMGGDTPGEIGTIGQMVTHQKGFLTGLNNQHAGLYGGLQGAIDSECEILQQLEQSDGTLYLNVDSDHIDSFAIPGNVATVAYSIKNSKADAYTKIVDYSTGVRTCHFAYKETTMSFETDVVGRHNILNLTGAIACCLDMGVSVDSLMVGVKKLASHQKTMTTFSVGDSLIIDDSYNINIDGVRAACDLLADMKNYTHKVLVINEINELGDEALSTHHQLGEILSKSIADSLFLTGENYTSSILQGLGDVKIDVVDCHEKGAKKSFDMLEELTRTNSLIIFLGREQGSMKFLKKLID